MAYESITGSSGVLERIEAWAPDAIVFGTLAQRFAGTRDLTRRVAADPGPKERLYDVNLRDGCWTPELVLDLLPLATVVKVDDAEAAVVASLLGCDRTAAGIGERLAAVSGVHTVCVTRGPNGADMWSSGEMSTVAGIPVAVADTVGAGDAFAAALLHGILVGHAGRGIARRSRTGLGRWSPHVRCPAVLEARRDPLGHVGQQVVAGSDRDRLAVLAEDAAQDAAHLAERGVGLGRADEVRHQVRSRSSPGVRPPRAARAAPPRPRWRRARARVRSSRASWRSSEPGGTASTGTVVSSVSST